MIQKTPICPQRIRKVPKQFSWVDQRLVRDRRLDQCSHAAAALYLFLVTVADAQGLSYYADATIGQRLSMDAAVLEQARRDLIQADLVAYHSPIYQVLPLAPVPMATTRQTGQPQSLGQILKHIKEGTP